MMDNTILRYSTLIPIVRSVSPILLVFLLAKFLPKEDYGFYVYCIGVIGLILSVSSLNIMYSMQVAANKENISQYSLAESVFIFKITTTIIIGLIFTLFLLLQENIDFKTFAFLNLMLFFRVLNDFIFGYTRAINAFKQQFYFSTAEQLIFPLSILFIAVTNELTIFNVFFSFIVSQFISTAFFLLFLSKDMFKLLPKLLNFSYIKTLLLIGLPMLPFTFSDLIISSIFPQIIFIEFGGSVTAEYAVAQKVAILVTFPAMVLNNFYLQQLTIANEANAEKFISTLLKFILNFSLAMLAVLIFITFLKEIIISFFFNIDYLGSLDAIQNLMYCYFLITLCSVLSGYFAVLQKTKVVGLLWINVLIFTSIIIYFCQFESYTDLIFAYNQILLLAFVCLCILI